MYSRPETVQPRYRNPWLVAAQLTRRALFGEPVHPLTVGTKRRASGGDGSHWNLPGILNPDLDAHGVLDFWFNKLTEGITYLDNSYALNWPGMLKLPVRGPYHYQLSEYSGVAQMSWFLLCLTPYHKDCNVLAIDFERTGNTFTTAFMVQLHESFEWLKPRTDARLELYTNRSLRNWLHYESLRYYGTDVFLDPRIGLWLSSPLFTPNPDMTPIMPDGVSEWDFLQWTWTFDGNPFIADKTIDFNVYNGDRAQMLADFGIATKPPQPPEDKEMDTQKILQEAKDAKALAEQLVVKADNIIAEVEGTPPTPPPPPPTPFTDAYVCTADTLYIRQSPAGAATGKYLHKDEVCRVDPTKDTLVGSVTWHYHDGGPSGQLGWSSGAYLKKA